MARQISKNLDKVPMKRGAGVTKRRTQNVVARAFRELKRGRLLDYVVSTVSVYFDQQRSGGVVLSSPVSQFVPSPSRWSKASTGFSLSLQGSLSPPVFKTPSPFSKSSMNPHSALRSRLNSSTGLQYFGDEEVKQEKSCEKTVFSKTKGGISKRSNSAKKGGLFQRIKSARLFQSAMKGAVRSVRAIEDAITVTTNHLTAKFILPLLSDEPPDRL